MDILEDVLLPSVRAVYPAPEHIFMVQDNCPVHTSLLVREWFEEHPSITPLFWPAKSPDLNPIEHLWARMTLEWDHKNERTPSALMEHVREVWEAFRGRPQLCES